MIWIAVSLSILGSMLAVLGAYLEFRLLKLRHSPGYEFHLNRKSVLIGTLLGLSGALIGISGIILAPIALGYF